MQGIFGQSSGFRWTIGIVSTLFLVLALNACKCKKSDCINGQCSRGECLCDFGWEGPNCDVAFRDKYLGNWSVLGLCNSGISNYSITITTSPKSNTHIYIDNLYDSSIQVEAEIVTSSTFNIGTQSFDSSSISGEGTFDVTENLLTITYNVTGFTPEEDCIAELKR